MITATFTQNQAQPALDHFVFDTISGTKTAGTAFSVTIRAIDQFGNAFTSYTATNTLTVSSGTISPTTTTAFTAGVWTGSVTLYTSGSGITITTTGNSKTGTSGSITVNAGTGTFGNTVQSGNGYNSIRDTITGGQFTCSQSGTAQSISAYIQVSSTHTIKAAIYTTGGTLVGSTTENSVTTANDGWVTFSFSGTKPTLTTGTSYLIVVWANSGSGTANLYYSATTGGTPKYDDATYGTWPNSATFTSGNVLYSIYCTYSIP